MAATQKEIGEWFDRGVEQGATHMIIVCDTFDYDDYPVYVTPQQNVKEVESKYRDNNMQRVMEVYDLRKDKAAQLKQTRVFNY